MMNLQQQAIGRIADDLRPVRPLPGTAALLAEALILLGVTLRIVVWLFGTHGFTSMSVGERFAFGFVLLAGAAVLAYGLVTSLVPGSLVKIPVGSVTLALALVFLVEVLVFFRQTYAFDLMPIHRGCFLRGLAAAGLAGIVVVLTQRRGFSTNRARAIMIGFGTSAAVALFALTVYCPIQAWSHVFISHVGAVLVILLAGALTAQLTR